VRETFVLPRRQFVRLQSAAERAFPGEACGLIAATRSGSTRKLFLLPVENASSHPHAFRMAPVGLSEARRAAARRGLAALGYFHTHPSGDPHPSWLDRRSMGRSGAWWLIYSHPRRTLRMTREGRGGIERARLVIR